MTSRPFHHCGEPFNLLSIEWERSDRILVLAPHPDDFDVIAVTLRHFHHNGNPLNVAVARGGSGVDDDYPGAKDADSKAELRCEEQLSSLRYFGLPLECLTFVDMENDREGQMIDSYFNFDTVEGLLRKFEPNIVFLPHGNDTNSAHRAMYRHVSDALQCMPVKPLALLVCDPKTIAMRIDLYTPFDREDAEWKAQMLRLHDTQQQRNLRKRGKGFDERILDVDRIAATKLNLYLPFAETFEIHH